ncbi:NAD(P)-dependent oxidoreductase [Thioalkalivibrio sulfidiphilus]|uniref:2-hydroxy-3-oxopropionate reductase n=1 Tax=Thioalkalivibrio sulfidiphilus (strain HL-EbGR7) TaxID=396588 RepID=B8GPD4_THISH|nr:NAD(P)-dependent oxidoreductase [Thioalkalivibrio sulfidiphilus]ACL74054.1 2-hydroxy-3-oxopropionate reductase [Thioalkalivibrio sulfidiphilus HL-EbGr7]
MSKVGLLGTGLMGVPMGEALLRAGHELRVYNRTRERARPLLEAGALWCDSPARVLTDSEVVVLMLSDRAAIEASLLSDASRAALAGRTVIQMGTIAPNESRDLRDAVVEAGGEYLEAPVLGSIPEARASTLLVMVGADSAEAFEQWREVFTAFGPNPVHVGGVGQAAALKLAFNQLIASLTTAFSLSLALIRREGVSVDLFMDMLRESALYAPTFDKKLERMLKADFSNPNFPVKHMLKDVNLVALAAREAGVDAGLLAPVRENLERVMAAGHGEEDYSALYLGLEQRKPDRT